jgi:hypothetical protein
VGHVVGDAMTSDEYTLDPRQPVAARLVLLRAIVGLAVFAIGSDIWQGAGDDAMRAVAGLLVMAASLVILTYLPRRGTLDAARKEAGNATE